MGWGLYTQLLINHQLPGARYYHDGFAFKLCFHRGSLKLVQNTEKFKYRSVFKCFPEQGSYTGIISLLLSRADLLSSYLNAVSILLTILIVKHLWQLQYNYFHAWLSNMLSSIESFQHGGDLRPGVRLCHLVRQADAEDLLRQLEDGRVWAPHGEVVVRRHRDLPRIYGLQVSWTRRF